MTRHQEPMTTRSTALLQQIEGGVLGRYRSCLFSGHDTPPAQLTLPLPSVYHLHSQFATLVFLRAMTKSPSSSTICLVNFFCVPIASMVIIQPERDSFWSNNGMAVISFDFLSTATCASTRRFSAAHALTICNASFPLILS